MMRKLFIILFLLIVAKSFSQDLKDCSTCSTQILKEVQIKDLSIDEIRFLTNDLFARKGFQFQDEDIQSFYSEKKWYKPISDNNKILHNTIEKQNIKLFQDKTKELITNREKLINALKNLKSKLASNNKKILTNDFNFPTYENLEIYTYISTAMQQINLNDIHWSKQEGGYSVRIDNGDFVMVYEISIIKNKIVVSYANQGGSEFEELLYPTNRIIEYSYIWSFEWENNKLKFLEMIVVG